MARRRFVFLLMVLVNLVANDEVGNESCNGITRGRHFVLVYTGNSGSSPKLSLSVITFSTLPTNVTVRSEHLINGARFEETVQIEARGSTRIQLPNELILGIHSHRSDKVVTVDADTDVSVYGLNSVQYSTDAFLSIPVKSLGVSYVATTYDFSDPSFRSLFAVVGVEENTTVGIVFTATITFEGETYFPGTTLEIRVDKHEVFQFVADLGNEYIGGSTITSDKPVAVFSGSTCASHPWSACDVLSEQIVPVKSWGKTHIYTATGSSQDSAIYNIHVYYKDTVVNIPGRTSVLLQPGQHWQGELTGSGVITTSQPASVVQILQTINGSFVDPSLIQVPSEEQFGRKFGFSTPPKSTHDDEGFFNFLNIVVTKGESKHVLLNNQPLSYYGNNVTSHDIPGIGYEAFIVHVPKGEAVYFVEQDSVTNTSSISVVVYGYESYETYGCAAGLSLPSDGRLLSFHPLFLREVGREQLVVTLPNCVESNELINQTTFCTFHAFTESKNYTRAHVLDSYTLTCTTPMFYEVGYIAVEVSLLGKNRTVTFRGNVYVASQDVLPPVIVVQQQDQPTGILDFTTNATILLEWPASGLPNFEIVDISFQLAVHESDGDIVWTGDISDVVLWKVNNTGTYKFKPADLANTLGIITQVGTSTMTFNIHPSTSQKPLLHVLSSGFLIILGTTSCSDWTGKLISHKVDDIDPCPCTNAQASADGNFQKDEYYDVNYFHHGASSCYRRAAANGSAGQECCYNYEGNILFPPTGGGTADAVAPGNSMNLGTFLHYFYDVLPWFSCCKLSTQCDEYYIYRPADDCSTYVPLIPTGGTGDPHFKSLDGKDFTFNGAGEFLLLRSALDNTIFQVRMEILPGTKASVYTAFAISSNSSLPVQIQRSPLNDTLIVVEGVPLDMYYNGFLIHRQNFKGLRIEVNSDVSEVRISLHSGVALVVRITNEMMSFILQLPDLFKGRVEGLLGNFNGDPDDDLITRNGSIVSPNSSLELIHYEFGLSWILEEHNSIFTYFPPFSFLSFHMPSFTPYLEFPDPNNVSDDVVALCGDSPPCLFDAVSTGSLSFANETRQEIRDLETVIENSVKIVSCGFPGKVANGYINGSVYFVGYNITVICEEGFFLVGSSLMTCQKDGNWSSSLPTCNANYSSLDPWALGVIITISVVFVIAIFSIAFWLIRKRQMKYNVKETNQVAEQTQEDYVYEQNVESKDKL